MSPDPLNSTPTAGDTDIAIVGMALRVPGARSVGEFWSNLCAGVESIRDLTEDELRAAGESPEMMARDNYVARAAELPDMEMFDAEFFGMSPKDAAVMDPQHRHFLECCWEAMEDAGRLPEKAPGPVGVFAGCGMGSYFYFNVCSHRELVDDVGMFLLRHTGNDKDFLSTRASFLFDLNGPSVNVQTACSTSLVATHYACQSLLSHECDTALAGGVTIELPHRRGYLYHDREILSPDGHCRAFDHRSAGTVFGSGVGVVVLRRLADAIRDGDQIHAVIRGSAINNDGGQKAGYLAPSVNGQAAAIIEAQALSGVEADTIGYVECHGTGTYLGDPIEIEALTQAFRQSTDKAGFCRVGSVKSNIGHLDTAAGVISLIKAALVVKHGKIPASLGYEKPNPSIDFATSPFVVNDRLTDWPAAAGPRRAGVNSLGVGGTNAHVIVEQMPSVKAVARDGAGPHLLVLSGRSRKSLGDAAQRLAQALHDDRDLRLCDVAFTLANGRRHFPHRLVVPVRDRDDAKAALGQPELRRSFTHSALDAPSGAVFLFSGGGSQYPDMARALYASDASVRATIDEGLSYLPEALARDIRSLCFQAEGAPGDAARRLLRPSVQLPAIAIVEVAIARRWMREGVTPKALMGHSMGENAAACISGVLSFADMVNLVRLRGELFDLVPPGGMLSVPLAEADLVGRMPADLDLASVNGPELCVVSGPADRLEAFRLALSADGIEAQTVPIDIAAHSRMLEPILPKFEAFLRSIRLSAPRIPIVSNLTGAWLSESDARDPAYWVRHLRSPVRFSQGLRVLAEDQGRVYVEVGPGRTLSSLVKAQGFIAPNQVVNSLPHADETLDSDLCLLGAFGRAWALGLPVSLTNRLPADARRVSLPTYPFQKQRYFLDRVVTAAPASRDSVPVRIETLENWGFRPVWRRSVPSLSTDTGPAQGSAWLVFVDDTGLGDALVARLAAGGQRTAVVRPGDSYRRIDRGHFTVCPEHGRDGYDSLLADLAGDGDLPDHIVHLWLTTGDESFRPGSSFFHRNLELGFYSLFFLGKALGAAELAQSVQVTVIGNGFQRVADEELRYPEKATVMGPALVLPKELPGVQVRVVDIPAPRPPAAGRWSRLAALRGAAAALPDGSLLDAVWEEITAEPGSDIVALRGDRRWTLQHARQPLGEATEAQRTWRRGGVYVVTGGLGDLALALAERLAASFGAKFVLLGRQEVPGYGAPARPVVDPRTRGIIERLKRIEAAGGEVACVRADVTNPVDVQAAFAAAEARFGTIAGVLHAAGTVRDDLIQVKQVADVEDVLAPKLYGTAVLRDAMEGRGIPLLVLFSSTSSDIAPVGQADYVAANCYLNAVAESDAGRTDRLTVAVHWGVWSDVGLASRAIEQAGARGPRHVPLLQPSILFDHVVGAPDGSEHVCGSWGPDSVWMLDEHRMGNGQAVVPGTGHLQAAVEAVRTRGVRGPVRLSDVMFIRPLVVPDHTAVAVSVNLAADGDAWRWAVLSEQSAGSRKGLVRHAEGLLTPIAGPSGGQIDIAALRSRIGQTTAAGDGAWIPVSQEAHLRFGPRWRNLRSLATGSGESLASVALPASFATDLADGFELHPGLLDIATGYAMALIPGYDPKDGLWVPFTCGSIQVFAPLQQSMWSWARLRSSDAAGLAAFDVTLADETGKVLVEVSGFTIRKLERNGTLALAYAPGDLETALSPGGRSEVSPAVARLAAQVALGIRADEGAEALTRALALRRPQVVISSLELDILKQQNRPLEASTTPAEGDLFQRPDLDSDYVAPGNDIERTLAGLWSDLLGVKSIGVNDSFFDLGGHSLIAARLFSRIKRTYDVDFPISLLFEAPTIAQCAQRIAEAGVPVSEEAGGDVPAAPVQPAGTAARFRHIVPMHGASHGHGTPLFVCAGMFGNILNLRQLAVRLGRERPVYGLQARGLYGGDTPHDDFAEMARDYIAEIKQVQKCGPYMLAGYSGGGLVAYEMARMLEDAGDDVAVVFLLDTPQPSKPTLSLWNRIEIRLQDLRRSGVPAIVDWALRKWEFRKARTVEAPEASEEDFHDKAIEQAFLRALAAYRVRPYGGRVVVVRPPLAIRYRLSDGRNLNEFRDEMTDTNGWAIHGADVSSAEVPGDHSSMMLEPHVRVLARALSDEIRVHESRIPVRAAAAE